jgi:N-acyl-D-aspartate/D-glutamate deacylase
MSARYDLLIRTTIDGTGQASYRGAAVTGGRIAALGDVEGSAALEIDGAGLTNCPGFVDAHSHADLSILQVPGAENLLMQGITTFVGGNCGIALAPIRDDSYFAATLKAWNLNLRAFWASFAEFLQEVESAGLAPNYLPLAGHNAIRGAVMGSDYQRPCRPEELAAMKELLRECLQAGCFGLSAGFDAGTPGHYAQMSEVVELARLVRVRRGSRTPASPEPVARQPRGGERLGIYSGPKGRSHGAAITAWKPWRYCLAGGVRLHIAHPPSPT